MQKLSISMPPSTGERVRETVREDGLTISAFMVEAAAENELRRRGMWLAVEECQREHGWFTYEEIAAAETEQPVIVGAAEQEST